MIVSSKMLLKKLSSCCKLCRTFRADNPFSIQSSRWYSYWPIIRSQQKFPCHSTILFNVRGSSLSQYHNPHRNLSTCIGIRLQKSDSTILQGSSAKEETPEEAEERKKRENSARALKYTLIAFGAMFLGTCGYTFFIWGAPQKDSFGDDIKDEFTGLPFIQQYYKRCMNEIWNYKTFLAEPSREKLLPDPVKLPYLQPPYTLLLEITDVLVHPEWTYRTGWRFRKRPGVDYFLNQVAAAGQFEIVIYSQESGFTAYPIVGALDTNHVITYTLFRDSTKYTDDGRHVKDLDRINRDLHRVILVDCNPNAVKDHRDNAIILPKWFGNDDDRTLFDLATLLNTISGNQVEDVREVLNHYSKFDDPIEEFRRKRREYEEKEREREQLQISLKQKPAGTFAPTFSFLPSYFRRS